MRNPDSPDQPSSRAVPLSIRLTRELLRLLTRISPGLAAATAYRLWFRPTRSAVSPKAKRILREGRPRWIPCGTRRVASWEWGQGPGVLLLHGWNGCAGHLTPYVQPLLNSGFRVVALDFPAHGRSPGGQIDVYGMMEALAGVDLEFGPFRGVVAHSFGAIPLASALMERKLSIQCAVCIAPATRRNSLLSAFGSQLDLPDVVMTEVARRVSAFTGESFWDQIMIKAPTLLIHDAEDDQIPLSDAEAIVQEWPDTSLIVTHGLGHLRILSDPSVIHEAVAFLGGGSH